MLLGLASPKKKAMLLGLASPKKKAMLLSLVVMPKEQAEAVLLCVMPKEQAEACECPGISRKTALSPLLAYAPTLTLLPSLPTHH